MSSLQRDLRLWPGVAAMALGCILWLLIPLVFPDDALFGLLGAVVCGLLVVLWWLLFSRAAWIERIGALLVMVLAIVAVRRTILHPSLAGAGMGRLFYIYAVPVMAFALVVWAAATRRLGDRARRTSMVGVLAAAAAVFGLVRTDGITGDGHSQLAWRWSKTAEQQLLASSPASTVAPLRHTPEAAKVQPAPPVPAPAVAVPDAKAQVDNVGLDWPGFRGARRDGIIAGTSINTDWNTAKPVELWRKPIGPGWSSFAVADGRLYTQEQRGDLELISCYDATTGEPVWTHSDSARFYESNGGPGPRGTPTLHNGRVYALGATGIVNALDAKTGAVLWTRNAAADTGAKTPAWGFASSPLVVDEKLVVAASGSLAAYDLGTGDPVWKAEKAGGSYSSPHLLTIAGRQQLVLLTSTGAIAVAPADGAVLWKHSWEGAAMLQPAITLDGGVLITTGDAMGGNGTRRLSIAQGPTGWKAEEVWTSRGLKPYFNDSLVHKGHAYGFDGGILSCIDLKDGQRKWKGGRYGHGQALLLRDQDLLLVLSEAGEVALVKATPDEFSEIAKLQALEGKTWNHPVLFRNVLYVRNGEEMAAFRMQPAP